MRRMRLVGLGLLALTALYGVLNQAVLAELIAAWYQSSAVAETVAAHPPLAVLAESLAIQPPSPARTPLPTECDPKRPKFVYGFAELKARLGAKMGEPLECEQAIHAGGDTRQKTTTGYAYYRPTVNIPAFTSGDDRWALTQAGLVYWKGDVVDPPGIAQPTAMPQVLKQTSPGRFGP